MQKAVVEREDVDLEDLESIIGDADKLFDSEIAEASDEDVHNAVVAAETHEARAEIEAESAAVAASEDATAAAPTAPKAKRVSTKGLKPSEVIVKKVTDLDGTIVLTVEDAALAERKPFIDSVLESIDKMPKKVGEKAVNIFCHVANKVTLSVYTREAIHFVARKQPVTPKALREYYMAGTDLDGNVKKPYSAGTAASQTTQMFNLLPALKICVKSGDELVLNGASALKDVLLAAPAGGSEDEAAE